MDSGSKEEEELSEFVLESLSRSCSGIKIPTGVTSIQNLTPSTFFSISVQSLLIIINNNFNFNNNKTLSFLSTACDTIADYEHYYTSLSIADRFNMCSHLSSAVTSLGLNFTFHNFLYPSEEDYHRLIRFFVRKLSELPPQQLKQISSDKRVIPDLGNASFNDQADESANDTHLEAGEGSTTTLKGLKYNSDLPESTNSRSQDSSNQEGSEKLKMSKEVERELEAVLSETEKREEELCTLLATVENQTKVGPSRRSYIQRITEITKNSRKQAADIDRILKDTRELQLESNYIRERLNRAYTVVDETLFREGKKDPVGRQAHRLLTSIHESFEQISDKILNTDRLRRETVEYEAKISALSRRSFNVEKLQADLDAIKRENDFLELHGSNDDDSRIL